MKSFKQVSTDSKDLDKVQNNLSDFFAPLVRNPFVEGILLKDIELTSGNVTKVPHKLNRAPRGWFIVRKKANSNVWDAQDNNNIPDRTLDLNCSANVTIDIWVF